jgi:hypothetical protein
LAALASTSSNVSVAEAKPYVLFLRTDIAVEQNKKLCPLKDVSGQDLIVSVDGQKVSVPMAGASHALELQNALTLARTSASLTGLEIERSYTPRRDPRMQRQRDAMAAEAAMGDNASLAEGRMITGLNKDYVAFNSDLKNPNGGPMGGVAITAAAINDKARLIQNGAADSEALQAFKQMNRAEDLRQTDITSGGFARLAAENDMAQELYDALSVRFQVSSPVYLEKPYLVLITRFHAPDDKPGVARNAVFAKALNAFGSKPIKIDVLQRGFPLGFEIEDLQLHLYSDGHEIPTDVAQKRVPLSREEAFEYLKSKYLSGHKGDTLTATPALGRPDKNERLKLTPNQWNAVYYAKVSKDGLPLGTYLDEACSQAVDDTVGTLAQNVRYYPAMESGELVVGTAQLSWSQLKL